MKKFLKNFVFLALFIVIALSTAFLFFDKTAIERGIVFEPSREVYYMMTELENKAYLKSFNSSEGMKLSYLHIQGEKDFPKILFCHGNDANVSAEKIQKKHLFLADKGYEIFAIDYRGYGKSEGFPDEYGIYSDVADFTAHLADQYDISSEHTILWGHSLGSAIAIHTAMSQNFLGLIAEGGFTSIEDMRDYRIKHDDKGNFISNYLRNRLYTSLEITQKFSSREKIASISSPVLIIHAINDETVPYEMSVKLAELNPNAETYFSETGLHSDTGWQDKAILEFIEKLTEQVGLPRQ